MPALPLRSLMELNSAVAREDFPMSQATTWGTGGPAFLVDVLTMPALLEVLSVAEGSGARCVVLGNCSDVLICDDGVEGLCIRLTGDFTDIAIEGNSLRVGAGASLPSIATFAAKNGLAGLEFLSGIPGTSGGAVATNAGAFGSTTAGALASLEAVDLSGETKTVGAFKDAYRDSLVEPGLIVTSIRFDLISSSKKTVKEEMARQRALRAGSQPVGARTAGSVFKNPPGQSAGRLIDECGLKGAGVGGARVSDIHANFILNIGGATSADILELMRLVRDRVSRVYGIRLEPEVRLLGFEREAL